MALPSGQGPDPATGSSEVKPPTQARQGAVSGRVILVLAASVVLVVFGMLFAFWSR